MAPTPDLTAFKALSFDCYGTLVDWETCALTTLAPLLTQLPASHAYAADPGAAVARFDDLSNAQQVSHPTQLHSVNLALSYRALAAELGLAATDADADAAAAAPGVCAAFPDTAPALAVLARRYKLVLLSNVDRKNIGAALATGGLAEAPAFAAVYTAQDVGCYKPSHDNFAFLAARARAELGIDAGAGELLHVARSRKPPLGFLSVLWDGSGGQRRVSLPDPCPPACRVGRG